MGKGKEEHGPSEEPRHMLMLCFLHGLPLHDPVGILQAAILDEALWLLVNGSLIEEGFANSWSWEVESSFLRKVINIILHSLRQHLLILHSPPLLVFAQSWEVGTFTSSVSQKKEVSEKRSDSSEGTQWPCLALVSSAICASEHLGKLLHRTAYGLMSQPGGGWASILF